MSASQPAPPEAPPEASGESAQAEYEATAIVDPVDRGRQRSVETLRQSDARRRAAASVGDVLDVADGLSVQRTSGPSAVPIVRGQTGHHVLLRYGNLRLNDSLTRAGGSALLNLVDPLSFTQLRVERGPSSVLYGSDALGGTVVLEPLEPLLLDKPSVGGELYARGASAERGITGGGRVDLHGKRVAAYVSGGYDQHWNQIAGVGQGKQPYTRYWGYGTTAALKWAPAAGHAVTAQYQLGEIRDSPRTDLSEPGDVRLTSKLARNLGVLRYRAELKHARLDAWAAVISREEVRERFRADRDEWERDHVLSYQAGLRTEFSPWDGGHLLIGADMAHDDVQSEAREEPDSRPQPQRGRYVDGSRYSLFGGYFKLRQELSLWRVEGGLRLGGVRAIAPPDPVVADLGEQPRLDALELATAASLGVRRTIRERWYWVFNLLQGFRAPNFEDYQALGGGASAYSIPTTHLKPERAWTAETGFSGGDRHWHATTFVYATLLTDLIERVPSRIDGMTEIDGRPVKQRSNAARGVLTGVEAALSYRFDVGAELGSSFWAAYGVTDGIEGNAGRPEPATKVPPPMGRAWLGYARGDLWLRATLRYQAQQRRLSDADRDDVRICQTEPCTHVDGWAVVDLHGQLRVATRWVLSLSVENIANALYRPFASGVYGPGTNVVGMVSVSL